MKILPTWSMTESQEGLMSREEEIETIIHMLKSIWDRYPEWRLGQMLGELTNNADPYYYYMTDKKLLDIISVFMREEIESKCTFRD